MNKTLTNILMGTVLTLTGCSQSGLYTKSQIYLNEPKANGYDVCLTDNSDQYFVMNLSNIDHIGPDDGAVSITFHGDNGNIRSYDLTCIDVKKGSPLDRMTVDSLLRIYRDIKTIKK